MSNDRFRRETISCIQRVKARVINCSRQLLTRGGNIVSMSKAVLPQTAAFHSRQCIFFLCVGVSVSCDFFYKKLDFQRRLKSSCFLGFFFISLTNTQRDRIDRY